MRWTLSGVQLSPPAGTASGSFVYDADTNTYSNVDITTTPFSITVNGTVTAVSGQHYTAAGATNTNSYLLGIISGGGASFSMLFAQPLTNAGGTVGFLPQAAIFPPAFYLSGEGISVAPLVFRAITQGTVAATPPVTPAVGAPALSQTGILVLGVLLVCCTGRRLHDRTVAGS